jgi:peptide/nickel transport system permease protein
VTFLAETPETNLPIVEAVEVDDGRPRSTRGILPTFAVVWLSVLTFCAIFAGALPFVKAPNKVSSHLKKSPSMDHWFGTDRIGRDVFSRAIYGARTSLKIAALSIIIGILIGGTIGLIAGYYRKKIDYVTSLFVDIMLAFPALVLALAITSTLGHGTNQVVLALSILSIAPLIRVVRAQTLVYAQREFVLAAKGLGARDGRILFREILPNVMPSLLTFSLTGLAILIVAEGGLAFLGQSVKLPTPTWGFMIVDGYPQLEHQWWICIFPCILLFLTVLSFNVLGDVLSKRFDIKESLA